MLFNYVALDKEGKTIEGTIDAVSMEVAISSLQKRNLMISSIEPQKEKIGFGKNITLFAHVSNKDLVFLSRQLATLFSAQVSALRVFKLLGAEVESPTLAKVLDEVGSDLQGGSTISQALSKHPKVFSEFYVSMVKAGEESGKLDETFVYLADHLERTYEVTSKAKHALIYPAFVILTFIGVMVLMMTVVIPKIGQIIVESGQEIPIYTQIVLSISNFFIKYGIFLLIGLVIVGYLLWRYNKTPNGKEVIGEFKLGVPYVGTLYKKLYLSRIADNLHTMILSGIPMTQSLEITASVVGNDVYKNILDNVLEEVRGGAALSAAMSEYDEIPGIMTQMIRVGEETGELGNILDTLAQFYEREVKNAVDTLVGLIEPAMIVGLGLGVGVLLAAVLLPIYNVAGGV